MLYQNGKVKAVTLGSLGPSGVTSFNGRSGDVMPEKGDYSVEQVTGAAPKTSPVFTGSISLGRATNSTIGLWSYAIGNAPTASGAYSHAEGSVTLALGEASHAEGMSTNAAGDHSHAEGYNTNAAGDHSHAEGYSTNATGFRSHAEGSFTNALGEKSHAEGESTVSIGNRSHAEGYYTNASAEESHAEGHDVNASGQASHAEGYETTASNFASHVSGKRSKGMTNGGSKANIIGDVFVVGNGTGTSILSNALRLAYEGTLYLTKAYKSTGADYAEYFEWLDGNPLSEDRVGHFVTLEGTKIKIAQPGDYILGVVSGQPCVIGNADEDWLGRWEHDDFNRFVKEYLVDTETEVFPPENITEDELHLWLSANEVTKRGSQYFKMESQVVDYPTPSWRHKANPSYDASQPYIERQDRKEWDAIGMVGVLSVIDDGSCIPNSYATVSNNGIATAADTLEFAKSYRVIQRINDHVIKIVKA